MSRRCRASLIARAGGGSAGDGLSSGCDCGRAGGGISPPPCTEPLVYGQLLRDPGFEQISELQESRTTFGDWSGFDPGPGWEWSDGFFLGRYNLLPWWLSGSSSSVTLDTVEQRSGAFCTKHEVFTPSSQHLTSGNVISCNLQDSLSFAELEPFFRVQAGDFITISAWAKADNSDLGLRLSLVFADNVGPASRPSSSKDFIPPGDNTYHFYTHSQFVVDDPAFPLRPTYMMWPRWSAPQLGVNNGNVFIDDCSLNLFQGEQGILLCAFSSLITVDNNTTETSFLS